MRSINMYTKDVFTIYISCVHRSLTVCADAPAAVAAPLTLSINTFDFSCICTHNSRTFNYELMYFVQENINKFPLFLYV